MALKVQESCDICHWQCCLEPLIKVYLYPPIAALNTPLPCSRLFEKVEKIIVEVEIQDIAWVCVCVYK